MKQLTPFAAVLLFACSSCDGLVKSKNSDTPSGAQSSTGKAPSEKTASTASDADMLNGISVSQSGGLAVTKAYLSYEDGQLVPSTNKTKLGEAVYLNLFIDKGWTVKNGFVSLDATERIETADGRLVLNAPNLFKSMPQLEEEKAAHLLLKANITATSPDIDHFVVNYHVWDKNGNGDIKGHYKLYVEGGEQKAADGGRNEATQQKKE